MTRRQVTVIGAGVSGLTSSVALLLAGHDVRLLTAEPPANTTSALAAAVWHPCHPAPDLVYCERASRTYRMLRRFADDEVSGVRMRTLTEYFAGDRGTPWWAQCVADVRPVARGKVPPRFAFACSTSVPVVHAPSYLRHLMAMFHDLGGRFELGVAASPGALRREAGDRIVVNCAGYGSHRFGDRGLALTRGIVVRVAKPATSLGCHIDDTNPDRPTYVIEREDDVVLGGTVDLSMTSTVIGAPQIIDILDRCIALCEGVSELDVIDAHVGFRPFRRDVRVGRDPQDARVIHNYGHGGGGYTLSWGCADEVVALVDATHRTEPSPNSP